MRPADDKLLQFKPLLGVGGGAEGQACNAQLYKKHMQMLRGNKNGSMKLN